MEDLIKRIESGEFTKSLNQDISKALRQNSYPYRMDIGWAIDLAESVFPDAKWSVEVYKEGSSDYLGTIWTDKLYEALASTPDAALIIAILKASVIQKVDTPARTEA